MLLTVPAPKILPPGSLVEAVRALNWTQGRRTIRLISYVKQHNRLPQWLSVEARLWSRSGRTLYKLLYKLFRVEDGTFARRKSTRAYSFRPGALEAILEVGEERGWFFQGDEFELDSGMRATLQGWLLPDGLPGVKWESYKAIRTFARRLLDKQAPLRLQFYRSVRDGKPLRAYEVGGSATLQQLPRVPRSKLLAGYVDIDIRACNPVILNHLTQGQFPAIQEAAQDSETVRKRLTDAYGISRKDAKKAINAALCGSKAATRDYPLLKPLFEQCREAARGLLGERFSEERLVKDGRKQGYLWARDLTFLLEYHEGRAIDAATRYLRGRGCKVVGWMFDGMILTPESKEKFDPRKLCRFVQEATGLPVTFVVEVIG